MVMSTSSSSSSSGSSNSKIVNKGYSLGTIESSVTRLLVSTKHLLESLNQWAKAEADDKFVSDAYVKLGNDFRAATRSFNNAGIDVSDLGDVPKALRIILEAALSEAPSQDNLDRFLPNIRNIIVGLIQNLKIKQSKAKALAQEKQEKQDKLQKECSESENEQSRNINSSNTIKSNKYKPPKSSQTKQSDALTQLQSGNFLSRRASKRFSAYQYAKLTNSSPSSNSLATFNTPEMNKDIDVSISSEQDSTSSSTTYKKNESSNDEPHFIFLKLHDKTKKVNIKLPLSMASIRLLFVEKFAYSPGTDTFPDIYIKHSDTGISYELEDHMLESDLKPGSLLSLNELDNQKLIYQELDNKIKTLTNKFETLSTDVLEGVKDIVSSIEIPEPVTQQSISTNNTGLETQISSLSATDIKELENIQKELKVVRQLQSTNKKNILTSVSGLVEQIKELQDKGFQVSESSNRAYMEASHIKLSEESDELLTKVDDLQDLMDALRKDVAQRGVRIGERQLKSTQSEISEARESLSKMINYITKERVIWKRIWEAELDKVCEEQQFFNLQDDLTKDLEEDIKKIDETFLLIQQCSAEQIKSNVGVRNKFIAHLPEPGESLHDIKGAVLNEVIALKPDHQSRVEAIAKAERLREKERKHMNESKFQEELGSFVEDNKLKKSGGIDEIERIRQLKDSENLKSNFAIL